MLELRKRVRPNGAESFSLNLSEGIRRRCGGSVPRPAAGAKRKGHLRFPFLFELLPFPCLLARRRLPICDRCEIRGTSEDFFYRVYRNLFAVSDTLLLHRSENLRWARHSSAAQFFSALYRPAPADLDVWHNLSSQVLSIITN